jgi:uncharacterized membrane protein YfcA
VGATEPAAIASERPAAQSLPVAFVVGASVGVLGGLIGLGGAEFRLPLLIAVFGFTALSAVILNKAMSLLVVLSALPARLSAVSYSEISAHWSVVVNLLAGSLVGAWAGASWATRMASAMLYRVMAVLLVVIAAALAGTHAANVHGLGVHGLLQVALGVVAGAVIGLVAALMGVAGGELLIPTIVLLFANRHQDRRQPVPAGVGADDAGRVHPLQPRQQLPGARRQQAAGAGDGGRLGRRHRAGRPAAWRGGYRCVDPAAGRTADRVGRQGVATRLNDRTRPSTKPSVIGARPVFSRRGGLRR